MLAGVVMMALGRMAAGIAVLLLGVAVSSLWAYRLMGASGYDPGQAMSNGLSGQGKRRSDPGKRQQTDPGEQTAEIWEQLEK